MPPLFFNIKPMKLEIQVPLDGIQYSRVQVTTGDNPTDEDIAKGLALLDRTNNIFTDIKTGAREKPTDTLSTEMRDIEVEQLKQSQERTQDFINLLKDRYPEAYKEITSALNAQL